MRIVYTDNGAETTSDAWHLMHCTSGAILRRACKGEGLPASGTNADRGRRLAATGLTHEQVLTKYRREITR